MFHTIPEPVLERMRELERHDAQQREQALPRDQRYCQIPPESGRLLAILASLAPDGTTVEVGTSAGYSMMWIAMGREQRSGSIVTLEQSEWKLGLARETFARVGLSARVEIVPGDARLNLGRCRDIAFAFLDCHKPAYIECYEKIVSNLLPGGVLAADNIHSHQEALAAFVTHASSDPRMDVQVLAVGKGLLLGRRITSTTRGPI
jgi:caffeoyl-CoA O-methyltransferase